MEHNNFVLYHSHTSPPPSPKSIIYYGAGSLMFTLPPDTPFSHIFTDDFLMTLFLHPTPPTHLFPFEWNRLGRIISWSRQPNGFRKEVGPNPGQKITSTFGRFRIHGNDDIFPEGTGHSYRPFFPRVFLQTILQTQGRERETCVGWETTRESHHTD